LGTDTDTTGTDAGVVAVVIVDGVTLLLGVGMVATVTTAGV
jgi:hypothetical protein